MRRSLLTAGPSTLWGVWIPLSNGRMMYNVGSGFVLDSVVPPTSSTTYAMSPDRKTIYRAWDGASRTVDSVLQKSTDGVNWTNLVHPAVALSSSNYSSNTLACGSNYLLMGTPSSTSSNTARISTDFGLTWIAGGVSSSSPASVGAATFYGLGRNRFYQTLSNADTVWSASGATTGNSWGSASMTGTSTNPVYSFCDCEAGSYTLAVAWNGSSVSLYRTSTGTSWSGVQVLGSTSYGPSAYSTTLKKVLFWPQSSTVAGVLTDGVTQTNSTIPSGISSTPGSLAWGMGQFWLFQNTFNTNTYWTSTNGTSWTAQTGLPTNGLGSGYQPKLQGAGSGAAVGPVGA